VIFVEMFISRGKVLICRTYLARGEQKREERDQVVAGISVSVQVASNAPVVPWRAAPLVSAN
jgi:hypothetical protein